MEPPLRPPLPRHRVTADHVRAWTWKEGRDLLGELLPAPLAPSACIGTRTVGDFVIWDNTGVMHRATPYDPKSAREMHRTTMSGDEPIR